MPVGSLGRLSPSWREGCLARAPRWPSDPLAARADGAAIHRTKAAGHLARSAERRQRVDASHQGALVSLRERDGADELLVEGDAIPYLHMTFRNL